MSQTSFESDTLEPACDWWYNFTVSLPSRIGSSAASLISLIKKSPSLNYPVALSLLNFLFRPLYEYRSRPCFSLSISYILERVCGGIPKSSSLKISSGKLIIAKKIWARFPLLLTFNGSTSFGLKMLNIIKAAMRALVIEFIFECWCTLWKNLQR